MCSSDLAVHRLEALLDTPLVDALEPHAVDVRAELEKLTAQWAAIISVSFDIHINEQVPLRRGDLVVGIAEEAMANAVRHAHATEVQISVQQDRDDVVVRIANNGSRRISGEPGLGSRLLDSVSPDNWSLPSGPDGAILDVRLPGLAARETVA